MSELIKCPTCKTEYEAEPDKCGNCGYPFSATDREKSHFVAQQILKKGKISDTKDNIKKTRAILFFIGGINIVLPFVQYSNAQYGGFIIGTSIFIGLIFIVFGITAKKKPFISILIPLLLLVLGYTLNAIMDPITLIKGIVWKVIFIVSMLYSLVNIIESEKIKKESSHLSSKDYK